MSTVEGQIAARSPPKLVAEQGCVSRSFASVSDATSRSLGAESAGVSGTRRARPLSEAPP